MKRAKKVVTIEVETVLSNKELKNFIITNLEHDKWAVEILQVQVNKIKNE